VVLKKRVVILIPTHYNANNNGIREKINGDEYATTYMELTRQFGGCTYDPAVKHGGWIDDSDGKEYYDENTTFYSDYDDTEENKQFLNDYKEILKARFRQKEIYMTTSTIEII
jgi:hypothetical protein